MKMSVEVQNLGQIVRGCATDNDFFHVLIS
jgi:hypothetical protein